MTKPSSPISDGTLSASDRSYQTRLIPHIARLNTDLRDPISRDGIRHDLALAQAEGFDPQDLYEKAVRAKTLKGETKEPPPPYNEVMPGVEITPS